MRKLGLYVHIPFCLKKCNYCDFYSLACADVGKISEYVSMICTHMAKEASLYGDCEVDSVFIGGGTPSVIEPSDIRRLCSTVKKCFNLTQGAEFSIECNPCSLTSEKLRLYRDIGINRLSIGLQSSSPEELSSLGRIHSLSDFERAFKAAREAGFDNINVDIMYALPSQSVDALTKTLSYVSELSPEHISAYCLKIEDGTPFSKMELDVPDEDVQYDMYTATCKRLTELGYEQYEISNFAKKGRRCVHNLKYWHREEYIGFGPAAHSFFDGERYFYARDLDAYCDAIRKGVLPERISEGSDSASDTEVMDEYVMLAMRLCDGVNLDAFKERFGVEFESVYDISEYVRSGFIIKKDNSYAFSCKGFFVSNFILSSILKTI